MTLKGSKNPRPVRPFQGRKIFRAVIRRFALPPAIIWDTFGVCLLPTASLICEICGSSPLPCYTPGHAPRRCTHHSDSVRVGSRNTANATEPVPDGRSHTAPSTFEQPETFQNLLSEAAENLGSKRGWGSISLSCFSAGYGAVREILRRPEYFALVNNVLLLDGMHASYSPEGKLLADGGTIQASDIEVFVNFARAAVAGGRVSGGSSPRVSKGVFSKGVFNKGDAGRKTFVVTHSEIFPGAYASTTECADYLLAQLALKRQPRLREGPMGMQQLSAADAGGFHLRGYAGNSAPDHIDFLHAMPAWFGLFGVR